MAYHIATTNNTLFFPSFIIRFRPEGYSAMGILFSGKEELSVADYNYPSWHGLFPGFHKKVNVSDTDHNIDNTNDQNKSKDAINNYIIDNH